MLERLLRSWLVDGSSATVRTGQRHVPAGLLGL
jgi:hypothetical protein